MKSAIDQSGTISLNNGAILYCGGAEPSWQLAVGDVAAIGEYTNQSGPVQDDWFVVFVSRSSGQFFLASAYAAGLDHVRSSLGAMLGSSLAPSLANSTNFKSVVLWPPHLAGDEVMQFSAAVPSGIAARIAHAVLPRVSISLAPAVLLHVGRAGT